MKYKYYKKIDSNLLKIILQTLKMFSDELLFVVLLVLVALGVAIVWQCFCKFVAKLFCNSDASLVMIKPSLEGMI